MLRKIPYLIHALLLLEILTKQMLRDQVQLGCIFVNVEEGYVHPALVGKGANMLFNHPLANVLIHEDFE